jgi:hypothetical protein
MEVRFQLYTQHFILGGGAGGASGLRSCCGRDSKKKVPLLLPGIEPRFSSFERVTLHIDTVANVIVSTTVVVSYYVKGL